MTSITFIMSAVLLAWTLLPPQPTVFAVEKEADTAASLAVHAMKPDSRAEQLKRFFAFHKSPLAGEADHFVTEADRLNLDWKLVAAIAGVESTFGKRIPNNSYNAWGWGVFTGMADGVHFASWTEGITRVSEGIRYRYFDRGATTIEAIGRRYAASPRWANNVRFFLRKIEKFATTNPDLIAVSI